MRKNPFFLSLLLLLGVGCAPSTAPPPPDTVRCTLEAKQCPDGSYVGRVPPSCAFTACPTTSATSTSGYDQTSTFTVGATRKLDGDLTMTLDSIDDSRCKAGVQCVWAGELSASFRVTKGIDTQVLRLGEMTAKSVRLFDRTFTLVRIDTNLATVLVKK